MRNPRGQLGPIIDLLLLLYQCIILLKTLQLMSDCILSKADVNSDSTCQRNRQSMALSFG
ncbi:hypothetical protein T06_13672 [Trichinella sp. T6]|nr:hypothetical protein T06_13672 [Trichinella sp. T6]